MRHVGDGDDQAVPGTDARDVHGVVEIARILAVDRDERQRAQIAPDDGFFRMHVIGNALRGQEGRGIEFVGEAFRVCRGEDLEARIGSRTEVTDDLAAHGRLAVALQPHLDDVAILDARIARDRNRIGERAVVRFHPGRLRLSAVRAEHQLPAPLDDLRHLAGEPAVAAALDRHAHHVAVEGAAVPTRRHEHVVLAAGSAEDGRYEAVPLGLEMQHPGDESATRNSMRGRCRRPPLPLTFHHGGGHRSLVPLRARLCPPFAVRRSFRRRFEPVAVSVERRVPLSEQLAQRASQRLPRGVPEMQLPGELLQRQPVAARSIWTCIVRSLAALAPKGAETLSILIAVAVVRGAVTGHVLGEKRLERALQLRRHLARELVPAQRARRLVRAHERDAGRAEREVRFQRGGLVGRERSVDVLPEEFHAIRAMLEGIRQMLPSWVGVSMKLP